MWMGKQFAASERMRQEEYAEAEVGMTTIGGIPAAVRWRGEERNLPVFAPAGLAWVPEAGDTVLVIKSGSGEACVLAAEGKNLPDKLQPGEVCLYSRGGAILRLKNDGRIELWGEVYINGSKYGETQGE